MNIIMKSNFLGKFPAAAARYFFASQSAAVASTAQSAAVALSPLRSGVDLSSSYYKPPSTWGVTVVGYGTAFVIERFGKYAKTLYPGLNILIPFVDKIAYVQSLSIRGLNFYGQDAITKDDVPVHVDSFMRYQIFDPVLASYRVENADSTVTQLARKMMMTEIGKLTYKNAFLLSMSGSTLCNKIKIAINEALKELGLECESYMLGDIDLPADVIEAVKRKNLAGDKEKLEFLARRVRDLEREEIILKWLKKTRGFSPRRKGSGTIGDFLKMAQNY